MLREKMRREKVEPWCGTFAYLGVGDKDKAILSLEKQSMRAARARKSFVGSGGLLRSDPNPDSKPCYEGWECPVGRPVGRCIRKTLRR